MSEFLKQIARNREGNKYINREAVERLREYLALEERFENPPEVALKIRSESDNSSFSRDIAIATALQCYAPGVTEIKRRTSDRMQNIAENTLDAGHNTTRLHVYCTWKIIGASRNVVHDIFHSHPFYNSDQQSQRYVEVEEGSFIVPTNLTEKQRELFTNAANFANSCYFKLLTALAPEVEKRVRGMYPEAGWKVEETKNNRESKIKKLNQEIARYVLPIAQKTIFDHTLSELQLLRLFRATEMEHYSDESKYVIAKMIGEVCKVDPTILEELDTPFPTQEREKFSEEFRIAHFKEFDLPLRGKQSILIDSPGRLRRTLSGAVRNVLGIPANKIKESEAIKLLVDPSINKYLSDVYEVGIQDPLTATLRDVSLVFATKLSHTADSQRQRHRRTPGTNPPLEGLYAGFPDYITPLVIREIPSLNKMYQEMMKQIYKNVELVIKSGVQIEDALTLLPNAHAVRVTESGDLFDWIHRWKQRLCYLAQEEIFFISIEQVEEMGKFLPEAKDLFLAPCGLRQVSGIRPRCPEGSKWCGQPVYNWQIREYKENRFI